MDIKTLLVKRFLKDKGERFPLISVFGVLGVLIGVFSIIVVMSVMRGFEKELVKRLIGTQPHVYITDSNTPAVLKNWSEVIKKISDDPFMKDNLISSSPFVEGETILYFDKVTIGAIIFSVKDDFFDSMFIHPPGHREILLGEQLALSNQMMRNDEVELLSAWDIITATSTAPKIRSFKINDFVRTGSYARDLKYIYTNINDGMNYFTPIKGYPTGVALFCKRPAEIERMEYKLKGMFSNYPNLKIETWKDRNSRMFYSLKLERIAMLITLFFIVLVASFSIVVSLVLMIESKKREFTILISMGLKKNILRRIIMIIAVLKGTLGALIGGLLGTVFCYLLYKYKFISLPAIYYDTHLPVYLDISFNILVVFLAVLICLIGTLFPLRMISKFSVISQLRKDS
ncbi:MAG: FtsX-like permease family protein [Proteobacteria bacterium]|nr:FtsX-like permease family protein [Pseudomonadota bacterium]